MPERALSWAESDSDMCHTRSGNHQQGRRQKAVTVDYSPLEGDKSFNTSLINQTIPEDEVFEKEEHGSDSSPLLKDNTDSKKPQEEGMKTTTSKKQPHDALHRQDAVESIPMETVHVQRANSQ